MNNKKSKKYKYYPMHMHIHASCDKGSSMALNMYNASKLGMKYIWFTDHDTRMGLMKNYIREYSFGDGLLKTDGKVYQGFEKISNQTDLLINADEKTLTINSAESVDEWVSSGVYFTSSGKRHTYSLASGLGLSINVEEVSLEQNSRLIFAVKLSQRPPYMKNAYILYVMGDTDGLRGEYNQIITINKTCGKITLNLSEDALDDQNIGGKDNAFDTLYILIQTRNGAKASVKVSDFKIQRGKICEDLRQSLQQVADNAGKPYEVKPFVAFEVSEAGEHKLFFFRRSCFRISR